MLTVTQQILEFNKNRNPEMVLLKYAAMRETAFRFLRGACHLYYEDLHTSYSLPPSPAAWLCGDLHMENFGSFKGNDREVYFDINDFDEAVLGPALFDLSRLLVSVQVASGEAGYKEAYINQLLNAIINGYRGILQTGKPVTIENGTATGPVKKLLDNTEQRREKKLVKEKADKSRGFEKLTVDNKKTFAVDKPLKKELIAAVQTWLDETRGEGNRKIHDAAYMVAGTGSIGVNRYLMLATDTTNDKKYLIVLKQALPSSLQPFIQTTQPVWQNEAERINQVQFRMQHATPGGLGSLSFANEWYTVKWVQPEADKIGLASFLAEGKEQLALMDTLGRLSASAQLRSSGRNGSAAADELIGFGASKDWQQPLFAFVNKYAKKTAEDFAAYSRAYDNGICNRPE